MDPSCSGKVAGVKRRHLVPWSDEGGPTWAKEDWGTTAEYVTSVKFEGSNC